MMFSAVITSAAFGTLRRGLFAGVLILATWFGGLWQISAAEITNGTFTNLQQVIQVLDSTPRTAGNVRLTVTVCAADGSGTGVVAVKDATAAAILDLGSQPAAFVPGEQIIIEQTNCLLRLRDTGVQITAAPTINNDGSHTMSEARGETTLAAGRHPLVVEWFNGYKEYGLEVGCAEPGDTMHPMTATNLWLGGSNGLNGLPGLAVDCYEGTWNNLPDFNLLPPVKTGIATNFDLKFCTRGERVGLRFSGYFNAPREGKYIFSLLSDDGAMLFLGDPLVAVRKLGGGPAPAPADAFIGQPMVDPKEQAWMAVEGRVKFITQVDKGMEFQLLSGYAALNVRVADAAGIDPATLANARVRVAGVGHGVFNAENLPVLGELSAASGRDVQMLETCQAVTNKSLSLTTVQQVQSLSAAEAKRNLPVKIRGVVTSAPARYVNGLTIQDGTRGIYVNLEAIPFWIAPAVSQYWEVEGHTSPGNFAPEVVADKLTPIGHGQLPAPAHPSWNQLINGSMDVQWVEFQGLVTGVHSNTLTMLMPEGNLNVQLEDYDEHDLSRFKNAVIHIRGLLLAGWNADTREVLVGSLRIENGGISVDRPAPTDFSDAAAKSIHDLLLFDAQVLAFQRVKITGQIVHGGRQQMFLQQGESGLRILPVENSPTNIQTGDLVSAVGYPTIAGPSPTLREAFVHKIGHASLPAPKLLSEPDLKNCRLDSLLVQVDGKLNGWHREGNALVLEMQAGSQPFFARLESGDDSDAPPRVGSRLSLVGVYLAQGADQRTGNSAVGFELLLNSPTDIRVNSQPTWWTLPRLLGVTGALALALALTGFWITQLRRQVEQRTAQLHQEIHARELAERARALEAERARIARDLHDDLGSSLAEIAMLAKSQPLHREANAGFSALLDAITDRARGLIAALDVIVWAVDPEENTLQSLADYFSGFADEYLSNCGIVCRFEIPISFPAITLDGRLRHDLFLAVKEVLHNVVRHSRANEVQFVMALSDGILEITISDNGTGFLADVEHAGHGLKNLAGRLGKLGGTCQLDSRIGAGTTVRIQLRLPPAAVKLTRV